MLTTPRPFLAEDGAVSVRIRIANGVYGVLEIKDSGNQWIVEDGEVLGDGSTLGEFGHPVSRGGRYAISSSDLAGIFVGTPGNWQAAWREGDQVGGEDVVAFPHSRGNRPMLDGSGQVTFVLNLSLPSPHIGERLMRWNERDGLFGLARFGDPAPGGGSFVSFLNYNGVNVRGDAIIGAQIDRPDGTTVDSFIRLDNCLSDQLFADGFDDGTTDAWSLVAP